MIIDFETDALEGVIGAADQPAARNPGIAPRRLNATWIDRTFTELHLIGHTRAV
jgi:hypothetical protein